MNAVPLNVVDQLLGVPKDAIELTVDRPLQFVNMTLFKSIVALIFGAILLTSCSEQPVAKSRPTPTVDISDPLPAGAIVRIGTTRLRANGIRSLAVSPDGSIVVAGGGISQSMQPSIEAWAVENRKRAYSIAEGDTFVSVSPDGKLLATSGKYSDKAFRLWDLRSGKLEKEIAIAGLKGNRKSGYDSDYGIGHTAFSPDGQMIAVESWREDQRGKPEYPRFRSFHLVKVATGEVLRSFSLPDEQGYRYGAEQVVFAPESKSLAVIGGKKQSVYFIDTATTKVLGKLGTGAVDCRFFADGSKLIVSGYESLQLMDVETRSEIRTFKGFSTHSSGGPGPIALSPDQRLLAAGGGYGDPIIRIWDVSTGKLLRQFPHYYRGSATSLEFTPDGQYLVCGSGKFIHVLQVDDGREDALNDTPRGDLCGVFFSPDGKTVSLCGDDRGVRTHELSTGRRVRWFDKTEYVRSIAFSPDGSMLATVGQTIKLWNPATGDAIRTLQENLVRTKGDAWSISSAAFLADGKQLLTGSHFGVMQLWDVETGKEVRKYQQPLDNNQHPGSIHNLVVFPNEKRVATLSGDVFVWDLQQGKLLARFDGGNSNYEVCSPLAVSPDGQLLAFESIPRSNNERAVQGVVLQEVDGDKVARHLENPGPNGRDLTDVSVAFSPNGHLLATGGSDRSVRVWDVATAKEIKRFDGHLDLVSSLTFSPDGNAIASASHDGTVLVWDVKDIEDANAESLRRQ